MTGRLNDILPTPVDDATEEAILELIQRKMTGACSIATRLLRAAERRFGPEARELIDDLIAEQQARPRPEAGDPEADLHDFCDALERGCVGSHRWERVADEPDRIGYRFTRCAWAEAFRALGEPELGFVLCAGDEPAVKSYNPALGFLRTQTLMCGDPVCDHVFYVEDRDR